MALADYSYTKGSMPLQTRQQILALVEKRVAAELAFVYAIGNNEDTKKLQELVRKKGRLKIKLDYLVRNL